MRDLRKSAAVLGYYFLGFTLGGGLGEGDTGFYFSVYFPCGFSFSFSIISFSFSFSSLGLVYLVSLNSLLDLPSDPFVVT